MALMTAMAVLVQSGCGGGSGSGAKLPLVATPGLVAVLGGDAPQCSTVVSFSVTIDSLTLTPQSGGSAVSIISSTNPVTVDFASLMDLTTILKLSDVQPGVYSAIGMTLSNPQLTYLDTSTSPASLKTISPTLSSLSITLNLSPAVTLTSNGILGLRLDFDLLNSILTDSNHQITGNVNPTFTATIESASGSNGYGEFEDLTGLVQSVSTSSTNPSYTGSFTISRPNTQTFTVYVTDSTTFSRVSGLSGLTNGTFVEIDAYLDANGNIVGTTVQAEDMEDQASGEAAFAGIITSVTPQSGSATQFTLLVRDENPDMSSRVAVGSLLTVSLNSSPTFGLAAAATNFANFSYGTTALTAGQRVVVHGTLPSGSGTAQTAVARSVYLGLQSILGNLSTNLSTPVVTSDGVAGGFTLIPCSSLFQPAQITVLSSDQTSFAGISDLNSLSASGQYLLLVKGLLFYQQTINTFGIVSWTLPANVQTAKQIHQLN